MPFNIAQIFVRSATSDGSCQSCASLTLKGLNMILKFEDNHITSF